MKLSEKIYTCRKKAGLSQEALAEKLGVSRQAVSKWETDEAIPELAKIPMMAKIFGVTTDFLLSEEENFEEPKKQQEEIPKTEQPKNFTTPDWAKDIPHTVESSFLKYGWILGVIVAIVGVGMILTNGFLLVFSVATTSTGFINPFLIIDIIGFLIGIAVFTTGIYLVRYLKKTVK